jgi:hypothetical protein
MKSQALQKMVLKIFSDDETKARFMANPENVLTGYSLTRAEKKAMLITHARLGLICSASAQLETAVQSISIWI